MKRGILLIIFILMAATALADRVTLESPDAEVLANNRTAVFECSASAINNFTSIQLFLGTDELALNQSAEGVDDNETAQMFMVEGLANGSYAWNCEALLHNGSRIVAVDNFTLNVSVEDIAQEPGDLNFTQDIDDISITMGEEYELNLSEHFDYGGELTYTFQDMLHIDVEVEGNIATIIPEQGWSGNSSQQVNASTGQESVLSNEFYILSINPNALPPIEELKIQSVSPIETPYEIAVDGSQMFSMEVNEDNVSYQWFLDGQPIQGATSSSYTLSNQGQMQRQLQVVAGNNKNETVAHMWVVYGAKPEEPMMPAPEPEPVEPVCGNGVREVGEDCENCPEDVICGPNFECLDGECVQSKEGFIGVMIAIIAGILALAVGAVFVFKFIRKQAKPEKPEIKPLAEAEKPKAEPQPQEKPKPLPKPDPLLVSFISKMRAKGKSDEEIKAKLKATGWTDEQIEPGFR